MSTEIIKAKNVKQADLPVVIAEQYDKLKELEDNVERAYTLAQSASDSADNAFYKSAGFGHKKAAIESLQDAVKDLGSAQISAAEAQKISFEYQTKLAEITKYLFGLGASNIAMNRSVVRELELKLKGASAEEISDLAKQELVNVVTQLKAQEDIMLKQDKIMKEVKANHEGISQINADITKINSETDKHETAISDNADRIEQNKKELTAQHLKDEEHDKVLEKHSKELAAQRLKDQELDKELEDHNKELTAQHLKDEEHDRALEEHSKELTAQHLKDEEHDRALEEHSKELTAQHLKDEEHDKALEKHSKELAAQRLKDQELDKELEDHHKELTAQHLKDEEHDRALEEHNKELSAQHLKDEEHDKALEEHSKELAAQRLKDQELDKELEDHHKELTAQHLKDEEHDRALEEHNKELSAQHLKDEEHDKALEEHSKELATQHLKDEELEKRLADLLNIFSKFEQDTNEQNRANEGYLNEIRKQLSDISIADENGRKELSERADSLQNTLNKKGFKISVSAVAILSLILNLLQIFGVITPLF